MTELKPTRRDLKRYSERDLLLLIHADLQKLLYAVGALFAVHLAGPVLQSGPFMTMSEIFLVFASSFALLTLIRAGRQGWIVGAKLRFAVMLGTLLSALVVLTSARLVVPGLDPSAITPFVSIAFSATLIWWALSIPVNGSIGEEK